MSEQLDRLANEIEMAAKKAFLSLFANKERYYYCTLTTGCEGSTPVVSAWSAEAMARETAKHKDDEDFALMAKWSYADSPYYSFGYDEFSKVTEILEERPSIDDLSDDEWDRELSFRLQAMELAMKKLDSQGLFGLTQPRESVVVAVEVMPPVPLNTEIVSRLNDPTSRTMCEWLLEAAE